jgi:hypothetical protein
MSPSRQRFTRDVTVRATLNADSTVLDTVFRNAASGASRPRRAGREGTRLSTCRRPRCFGANVRGGSVRFTRRIPTIYLKIIKK